MTTPFPCDVLKPSCTGNTPRCFLPSLMLLFSFQAMAEPVTVSDAHSLIEAISHGASRIHVQGTIDLTSGYSSDSALPRVQGRSLEIHGLGQAGLKATEQGFRLLELGADSELRLINLEIASFHSPSDGGAILVQGGRLELDGVRFVGNRSEGDGGGVSIAEFARLRIVDSEFRGNQSAGSGGGIQLKVNGVVEQIARNRFTDNDAEVGCALALDMGSHIIVTDSLFAGDCQQSLLDVDSTWQGPSLYRNTWLVSSGRAISYRVPEQRGSGQLRLMANLMARLDEQTTGLCETNDVPGAQWPALDSRGANVATDSSCGLELDRDRVVGSANEILNLAALPQPLGEALDSLGPIQTDYAHASGRCGVADLNGLGRPQGDSGNTGFSCDAGAVERQQGDDIGAAQTGIYFDPSRSGEGYFVEILDDDLAWVAYFGYSPIGGSPPILTRRPSWMVGLGQVVGNSVVVPEMLAPSGGRFGSDFDPDALRFSYSPGALSMVFPTCGSGPGKPGRAYFRSKETGLADVPIHSNVLATAVRLGQVVACDGSAGSARAGWSGTFYDPQRDGEGVIVQWLSEDQAIIAWYTYSPDGRRFWLVSDTVEVDGNRLTAKMLYPAAATAFGAEFDSDEIELSPWGTVTLSYRNCQEADFHYTSQLPVFGSGSHMYQRLTQPAGAVCDM